MKKLTFAVLIACGCSQLVRAEQVQNWFTGGANGTQVVAERGQWESPLPTGVTVSDSKFALDLEYDVALDFTPTASAAPDTNVLTRVLTSATFIPEAGVLPTFTAQDAPKTALAVLDNAYYAYAGGEWVELTGEPSDSAVNVLIEVDYATATPRACFGIVSGNTTTYLFRASDPTEKWLTLGGTTPSPALIGKVSFTGEGEFSVLSGNVQLGVASYDSVKYPTVQDAVDQAAAAVGATTVTVLRDNDDPVEIPANTTITLQTNGKTCGVIDNKSDVAVAVSVPAATIELGNGVHTIDVSVSGNYTVTTDDTSKKVASTSIAQSGKVEATIITKEEYYDSLKVAGTTVPADSALAVFLQQNSPIFRGPHSTEVGIQGDIDAPGSNGMTVGQSYVLGLGTDERIILQPRAGDKNDNAIELEMPNVSVCDGFTVKYQVQVYDVTGSQWVNEGDLTVSPQIPVGYGSGRYRVNTVIVDSSAK